LVLRGRYSIIISKPPLTGWWVDKLKENYAIMPSLKGIGCKNRNFGGFSPCQQVQKMIFQLS